MSLKIFSSKVFDRLTKIFFLTVLLAVIVFPSATRLFDTYENILLDARFRLRPVQPFSPKITIIEISDDTLAQLSYWPLPRDFHASLIDVLSVCGVKAIMFDVLFVEPSEEDISLAEAIKKAGNVYLPFVLRMEDDSPVKIPSAKDKIAALLPQLTSEVKASGHINSRKDPDGKVRWAPLVIEDNSELRSHIALLMACDYLGIPCRDIQIKGNTLLVGKKLAIPVSKGGAVLVNYAGHWNETFRHYSYVDILTSFQQKLEGKTPKINLDDLKDSICFIGLTTAWR